MYTKCIPVFCKGRYDQTGHSPNTTRNVQANFLKQELRTRVTDMKRMSVEDSNLPTLDVNLSDKLETLQLSVPLIYMGDQTCLC